MEWLSRIVTGETRKGSILGLASLVLIVLTIATVLRNEIWRDDVRLFSDVVAKSPHKQRPYNALIYAHMKRGQEEQAISVAKLGAQNIPASRLSFLDTIGNLDLRLGRPAEAVEYFKSGSDEAVQFRASSDYLATSYNNLAVAYQALAKTLNGQDNTVKRLEVLRNAQQSYRKSLEVNPSNMQALDGFLNVTSRLGESAALEQELLKKLEA